MEKVSIIILNYNGKQFLSACLNSVFAQSYSEIEVVLVDNGSSDGSVEFIRSNFPSAILVESKINLGFAEGNNLGISAATGHYIVLLNNDTTVDKDWLVKLLEKIKSGNAGTACSKVITEGIPDKYYEMNGTINYLGYNIMREFSNLSQIFYAGGGSLIFARTLTSKPFLDEYFLYNEDTYFSWKLRLEGFNPQMASESIVYHIGSATAKKHQSSFITFYQERNRLLNCLIFYETQTIIKLTPYFILDGFTKLLLNLIRRRKSFTGIVRSYYWIIENSAWISNQRRQIQSSRNIDDNALMSLMSCKIIDGEGTIVDLINSFSKLYAKIVRLNFHGK